MPPGQSTLPPWMLFDPVYMQMMQQAQAQQQQQANQIIQQPQPTQAEQLGNAGGQLGGMYLGSQLMGGGGAAATAAPSAASFAPTIYGSEAVLAGTPAAGSVGGATTGAVGAASGSTAGATGAGMLPAAGVLAGGITGGLQASGAVKTFDDDKKLNIAEQAALALPTFGASFLVNPAKKFFGSGKGKAQRERDSIRGRAQQAGLLDKDFNLTFSDGLRANVGLDGGATFMTPSGKELKIAYENDWDNPLTSFVVGALNPLGTIMSGGKGRGLTSQLANVIVNSSTTKEEAYNRILDVYKQSGLDFNTAMGVIQELHKKGDLDDARALADQISLDMTFNNEEKLKAVNIPYGQDRPLSQGVGAATPQTGTTASPVSTAQQSPSSTPPVLPPPQQPQPAVRRM